MNTIQLPKMLDSCLNVYRCPQSDILPYEVSCLGMC